MILNMLCRRHSLSSIGLRTRVLGGYVILMAGGYGTLQSWAEEGVPPTTGLRKVWEAVYSYPLLYFLRRCHLGRSPAQLGEGLINFIKYLRRILFPLIFFLHWSQPTSIMPYFKGKIASWIQICLFNKQGVHWNGGQLPALLQLHCLAYRRFRIPECARWNHLHSELPKSLSRRAAFFVFTGLLHK